MPKDKGKAKATSPNAAAKGAGSAAAVAPPAQRGSSIETRDVVLNFAASKHLPPTVPQHSPPIIERLSVSAFIDSEGAAARTLTYFAVLVHLPPTPIRSKPLAHSVWMLESEKPLLPWGGELSGHALRCARIEFTDAFTG